MLTTNSAPSMQLRRRRRSKTDDEPPSKKMLKMSAPLQTMPADTMTSPANLDFRNFDIIGPISTYSRGTFGTVFKAQTINDGTMVAMKFFGYIHTDQAPSEFIEKVTRTSWSRNNSLKISYLTLILRRKSIKMSPLLASLA